MDDILKEINRQLHEIAMDDYYGDDDEDINWYEY